MLGRPDRRQTAIRKWMTLYNHQRPHSALGGKPPPGELLAEK
ncbi:hypothetical protein B6V76_19210 [Thioclava sp. IC9]|nr:hypothetical protein B6V76_19210 [Thioclava sp. IC9]